MLYENLIGNDRIKEILKKIKNPSHAYLFVGEEGIGKFLFAKDFSKTWLCTDENKPCGKCKSCLQLDGENHPDFNVIEAEDGSIKIDQIRPIVEKVLEKPIISDKKIYLINDADKMTIQAQNCLLKVLEEPPKYVMIILIGTSESQFLNTIKSRCVTIKFEKIPNEELKKYLEQNNDFQNVTQDMLEIYDGSIGKAMKMKGQEEKYQSIKKLIDSLENTTELQVLKNASFLYDEKIDMKNILEYINVILYKKGIENIKYINCIKNVNDMLQKLKINCNIEMNVDDLLIEMWREINK